MPSDSAAFVSRIVPDKGLQWLINTMAQLDPAIQLDVAGEGWAQPQMKRLTERLGVGDRIILLALVAGDYVQISQSLALLRVTAIVLHHWLTQVQTMDETSWAKSIRWAAGLE